jgi:hypothetical protein
LGVGLTHFTVKYSVVEDYKEHSLENFSRQVPGEEVRMTLRLILAGYVARMIVG